ncbi:MAG: hypothetical protein JKY63_06570 [Rhodobiaceae bacterium]|nr:hypothetical protein [Rhodobiaceae bacterium]
MIGTMMTRIPGFLIPISLIFLAAACTSLPQSSSPVAVCRSLIERVDLRIENKGVGDAQAARVDGYPYLRINRFLASFEGELGSPDAVNEWVQRLRALDREARQVELQNLGAANIVVTVDGCAESLFAADRESSTFTADLMAAAQAPRHYDDAARAIGLYPLTQIGVALGFERWKAQNLPTFNAKPEGTAATVQYGLQQGDPMSADEVAALIGLSANNSLGIPDLEGQLLEVLARQFAPTYVISETTGADQVGRPYWPSKEASAPRTDRDDPTIYVRLAHTRFEGEVLPQLVYSIWFPARPREGAFDLLGGELDGFVWRVTLGRDGTPLIYDGFHACGCYHLFFPTSKLTRRPVPEDHDLREEPLVPRTGPDLATDERLVLHLASGSHYLTALSVTADSAGEVPLRFVDENSGPEFGLRSLALAEGGRQSLFGPDGIVRGTQRRERFILWPMGIADPGAMRQWGTHATAFVGERHADDPFLFEGAFAR